MSRVGGGGGGGAREMLTVVSLCVVWYATSCGNNVVGKVLLSSLPFPLTVTLAQLASIAAYSGPALRYLSTEGRSPTSPSVHQGRSPSMKILVPLALGKFLSSVLSHVSIWKVPVSFVHTVKATMPLFTVILSRLIMGEKQTNKVYLSLVPIITGVTIATMTELSYDGIGMMCALVSTAGFSLQHIYSKKVLVDTGIHHLRLLHILGRLAFFLFIPVWLIFDFSRVIQDENLSSPRIIALLFADGFLCWIQNIVAFSVISLVTPLTYAIANASKRIFVIGVSLCILGNPVTTVNMLGMLLAIAGVFCYNKAKYDQRREQKKTPVLPLVQKNNEHTLMRSFNMQKSDYTNGALRNGYHLLTPTEDASPHIPPDVARNHSKLLFV